ncbi:ABC transporter permease subunit [Sporolactobacillus spathodeae]|uniref:ABC-2 type transport system permease protein n=1 Tax=Sporolactobacillus spathodeae TaxID=1465502 RepID=A0ABS2Q899_9BACL|nr:ABC transporter permease subunit [Sporolactobacillus spathodeae]MBM7658015.1 ABC-2 type transport system permease protein [Sporolactobacillus spathodeae]
MNIYLHELRSLRKSVLIWTLVLIGLAALYLSIYPSIVHDADGYRKLLATYPPAVRAALGINLNTILSINGYYGMIFSFVTLCGTIQAMNLGLSVLSRESRERTADFLLVKPVARRSIVSAKWLAGLTALLVTDLVYYGVLLLLVDWVKKSNYDGEIFLLINLTLLFLQMIFFALGLLISVFFNKLKSVLPLSLGTVIGWYMIGALLASGKESDTVRYFSPFNFFPPSEIIQHAGYQGHYLTLTLCFVVLALAISYLVYSKKDIHSVS